MATLLEDDDAVDFRDSEIIDYLDQLFMAADTDSNIKTILDKYAAYYLLKYGNQTRH